MVTGSSSTKMEYVVKMMQNSGRNNYKNITSQAKALQAAQKATGTGLDFRKINVQQNEIGERLATKKELRSFKKKFGQNGVKLIIDKKGKRLPDNVVGGFDFNTGEIILPKNPTQIALHHEGFHAGQWLDIGQDAYTKLSPLQREEYVFEQIMKNRHLFDQASIQHSINYINRLRQTLR